MSKMKFIDACLNGDVLLEEIDDYIDEWHDGDSEEDLHEYLGMTIEEYGMWVENDALLKTIVFCRNQGIGINEYLSSGGADKLAARASSPEEAALVKEWLERKGYTV